MKMNVPVPTIAMDLEKENICPIAQLCQSQSLSKQSFETRQRRSPLPYGFPRSPLQDITHHVLFPNQASLLNAEASCLHCLQTSSDDLRLDSCAPSLRSNAKRFKPDADSQSSFSDVKPCACLQNGSEVMTCIHLRSELDIIQTERRENREAAAASSFAIGAFLLAAKHSSCARSVVINLVTI